MWKIQSVCSFILCSFHMGKSGKKRKKYFYQWPSELPANLHWSICQDWQNGRCRLLKRLPVCMWVIFFLCLLLAIWVEQRISALKNNFYQFPRSCNFSALFSTQFWQHHHWVKISFQVCRNTPSRNWIFLKNLEMLEFCKNLVTPQITWSHKNSSLLIKWLVHKLLIS